MMKTTLQCPSWDEDNPRHDPAHEERFHDVVNGLFEKTVSCIGQDFEVVTKNLSKTPQGEAARGVLSARS